VPDGARQLRRPTTEDRRKGENPGPTWKEVETSGTKGSAPGFGPGAESIWNAMTSLSVADASGNRHARRQGTLQNPRARGVGQTNDFGISHRSPTATAVGGRVGDDPQLDPEPCHVPCRRLALKIRREFSDPRLRHARSRHQRDPEAVPNTPPRGNCADRLAPRVNGLPNRTPHRAFHKIQFQVHVSQRSHLPCPAILMPGYSSHHNILSDCQYRARTQSAKQRPALATGIQPSHERNGKRKSEQGTMPTTDIGYLVRGRGPPTLHPRHRREVCGAAHPKP
jgi:hypothetical protein